MARQIKNHPAPEVAIPITPMLDMTFQLLAFFIMTYKPNEVAEGINEFTLPATGNTKNADPTLTDLTDKDGTIPSKLTIRVETGQGANNPNKGSITAITVDDETKGGSFAPPNVDALGKYLKQKHDELNPLKRKERDDTTEIKLVMAGKLKHAEVMKVVDACLNTGQFAKISFGPPPTDSN